MSERTRKRRLSINPVEFLIFSVITVIFLNSVYKLVFDWQGAENFKLEPYAAVNPNQESRTPASLNDRSFTSLELDCTANVAESTTKAKVRLTGPLCGAQSEAKGRQLLTTEVTNAANQVHATVFTFDEEKRFSTDYIPLNRGDNPIEMKFRYAGGKVVSKSITISRQ